MDRLISFLVLLPFLVYFIIPLFMIAAFYINKRVLRKGFIKIWSTSFTVLAILSTFAVMVVSAQADLAFNSGKMYLTEPLTQLSLASQLFGLFILNSVFTNDADKDWFQKVLKTMFSLGVLGYLIFSNQFLSVFMALVALLILAPTIKKKTKQILSGVLFGSLVFFYFLDLEFFKTFSEIRLSLLSGEVNQWLSLSLVFLVLIFMLLVTLTVVAKEKTLSFFEKTSWLLLSPVALMLCFYRLIQLGFISVDNITYDFSQWFVVFYLILFILLMYFKRFNLTGLLLAASAAHAMISMLFSFSGADNFSFALVSVHHYTVVSTVLLMALYFINKMEIKKGARLELNDIQLLSNSASKTSFIIFTVVLFASALPPGPLFLVTFAGVKSLIEVGLYWTVLWSLVSLGMLGYFLFSAFSVQKDVLGNDQKAAFELWKKKPGDDLSFDFKEFVFILMCCLALYGVAFLNL